MSSSGKSILFCDADGASKFSDIHKLERVLALTMKDGFSVATGCRSNLSEDVVVKVSLSISLDSIIAIF